MRLYWSTQKSGSLSYLSWQTVKPWCNACYAKLRSRTFFSVVGSLLLWPERDETDANKYILIIIVELKGLIRQTKNLKHLGNYWKISRGLLWNPNPFSHSCTELKNTSVSRSGVQSFSLRQSSDCLGNLWEVEMVNLANLHAEKTHIYIFWAQRRIVLVWWKNERLPPSSRVLRHDFEERRLSYSIRNPQDFVQGLLGARPGS